MNKIEHIQNVLNSFEKLTGKALIYRKSPEEDFFQIENGKLDYPILSNYVRASQVLVGDWLIVMSKMDGYYSTKKKITLQEKNQLGYCARG